MGFDWDKYERSVFPPVDLNTSAPHALLDLHKRVEALEEHPPSKVLPECACIGQSAMFLEWLDRYAVLGKDVRPVVICRTIQDKFIELFKEVE